MLRVLSTFEIVFGNHGRRVPRDKEEKDHPDVISAKFKSHGGVLVSMAYPCPMTFKMSESLQTNNKAFQFEH